MIQEYKDAAAMFERSTIAMDRLSPSLEFVVLQTGAKMYGCHLLENHPTDYIHVPLAESSPRIKSPYSESLFYHPQLDFIAEYAKNKKWNWCDTRPDIIIGFVPNQNFYSLATSLAVFMSLWREVEGEGSICPYPGTQTAWFAKSNDRYDSLIQTKKIVEEKERYCKQASTNTRNSSSDMIARQTLHLSLTLPLSKKGEGFNVADEKSPRAWVTKWPELCSYFGLTGTAPPSNREPTEVRTYIKDNIDTWHKLEKKLGLKSGIADSDLTFKGFEYFLLTQFDFDRQYDMTKIYATGFKEERSTLEAWGGVFDRMRKAKMIP